MRGGPRWPDNPAPPQHPGQPQSARDTGTLAPPKTVITTRQQAIRLISVYRRTTVRRYRPEEVQLDLEASRLGVTRQLIIKEWLAERLERRRDPAGAAVAESESA